MFTSYLDYIEIAYSKKDRSDWPGTYASVLLSNNSKAALHKYFKPYIARLQEKSKFHITTTFTRKIIDIESRIARLELKPNFFKYEKFGPSTLVLRVYHPTLQQLFVESKKAGATWDFASYKPHITLSTEFPSDIANLPPLPPFSIYTTRHVVEALDDD